MRTQKYLKLHNRCFSCLEMIEKCDSNIYRFRSDLAKVRAKNNTFPWDTLDIEANYLKQINRLECIRIRLIRYYSDIFERLQGETHEFRNPVLMPPAPTPLTTFTTDMDAEEENKILHNFIGGINSDLEAEVRAYCQ